MEREKINVTNNNTPPSIREIYFLGVSFLSSKF